MITYTWKNIEIQCHHTMYGQSNVAFAGCGTLVATDENGVTSEKELSVGFSTPPNSGYTASSDITKEIAVCRIDPLGLDQLLHPTLDPKANKTILSRGLPASPGAASGKVVFNSEDAVEM